MARFKKRPVFKIDTPKQIQMVIILWVRPIYIVTLLQGAHIGQNAQAFLILHSKLNSQ
jgi:hypothetical protein